MCCKKYLILFTLLLATTFTFAQNYTLQNTQTVCRDYCFDKAIKTVRLYKQGNENIEPVISLRSNESIVLSFDDLSEDLRRFYYTITHCNADWEEEGLLLNDYVSGFPENQINDFNLSSNTAITYTNFWIQLPNSEIRLKISGNYLVKIYDVATRELVLQKGFSVVEPLMRVDAKIRNVAHVNRECMQQIDFNVAHPSVQVNDAFIDLKVRIEQNYARIPEVENPMPALTQIGVTEYTRPDKNMFKGNNEFRSFDIRNLSYNGIGVNQIRMVQNIYRVLLNEDKVKADGRYTAAQDINGRYIIGAERVSYPEVQSDYVDVFFTLVTNTPFVGGRVFIVGELTDWSINDSYEMIYNPEKSQYEATVLLKQGYYNYRYVVLNDDGKVDTDAVDGCFAETENNYTIYVYYRLPTDRYDRLMAVEKLNTHTVKR